MCDQRLQARLTRDVGDLAYFVCARILKKMSRLVIRGCYAITLLVVCACGQESTAAPKHPSAEARNGETERKTRKQRPVVAPPPAYGNKIVFDDDQPPELASASSDRARL